MSFTESVIEQAAIDWFTGLGVHHPPVGAIHELPLPNKSPLPNESPLHGEPPLPNESPLHGEPPLPNESPVNDQPHRKPLRLRDYDYSQPGEYFITLVTHDRERLFGDIVDFEMRLNPLGQMVWQEWNKIPILHPEMELGEFIVMPNHFHAIIIINNPPIGAIHELPLHDESPLPVRAVHEPPLPNEPPLQNDRISRRRMKIPMVIGRFKMNTAKWINQIRDTPGLPVWQRNYYEHIIRSEKEYLQIQAYIENNPANWVADSENL